MWEASGGAAHRAGLVESLSAPYSAATPSQVALARPVPDLRVLGRLRAVGGVKTALLSPLRSPQTKKTAAEATEYPVKCLIFMVGDDGIEPPTFSV